MVVPPLAPDQALNALRRDMRKLRQRLHGEQAWEPAALDPKIIDTLTRAVVVALYAPMSGEPDAAMIVSGIATITARPASTADGTMVFRRWTQGDPETNALWGGLQPTNDAPVVVPDVVVVPLVAFDARLNRLGQGGGYYDRYFAAHDAAIRIGVAWDAQRVDSLPVRPWDVPLDAVITDRHCYLKDSTRCVSSQTESHPTQSR